MYRDARSVGIPAEVFWRLTPRELEVEFEAWRRRHEQAMEHDMFIAWHIAAFQRAKRMPPWDRIQRRLTGRGRAVQSPAQMLAMVERLNTMFGGKDLRKKDIH